ncbi:MAG: hypothetical protein RM368_31275 [Nostoc sp. DedSLP03]|nr:hypothetical protein [Nostoc sp. DedSLP03]
MNESEIYTHHSIVAPPNSKSLRDAQVAYFFAEVRGLAICQSYRRLN